jgi:hypothetical protein
MRREARLKKQYAADWPCLRPGVWEPAAVIIDRLRACSLEHCAPARVALAGRLLDDEHFEFRGGAWRTGAWRTRANEW